MKTKNKTKGKNKKNIKNTNSNEIREFERIVEYSYFPKDNQYVVKFLDSSSYIIRLDDLPKKYSTKKPKWADCTLSSDRTAIIVQAGDEIREIPYHLIHTYGRSV